MSKHPVYCGDEACPVCRARVRQMVGPLRARGGNGSEVELGYPGKTYVYCVRDSVSGMFKVGHSGNLCSRLKALRSQWHCGPLELIGVDSLTGHWRTRDACKVERRMLASLADYVVEARGREWLTPGAENSVRELFISPCI